MKYIILVQTIIIGLICASVSIVSADAIDYASSFTKSTTSDTQLQPVTSTVNAPSQIEEHILASNEALKVLGGVGGLVAGGASGIVVGALIGGLVCPSLSQSSSNSNNISGLASMGCLIAAGAIGGGVGGMVFGLPMGVTLVGDGLHEDGHYWDAVLGGLVGPIVVGVYCEGISKCDDGVMWATGLSLNLVGSMVGYDLSRSYGKDKKVSVQLYPTFTIANNTKERKIDATLLKITF